jgi:hypothetical protein
MHNQAAFWGFTYVLIALICARPNLQSAICNCLGLVAKRRDVAIEFGLAFGAFDLERIAQIRREPLDQLIEVFYTRRRSLKPKRAVMFVFLLIIHGSFTDRPTWAAIRRTSSTMA